MTPCRFHCPKLRVKPVRGTHYHPTDYNYLCVHGWSLLPFFAGFDNDRSGICDRPVVAIRRTSEKPMIVCDGLGEHVGVPGEAVSNPESGPVPAAHRRAAWDVFRR